MRDKITNIPSPDPVIDIVLYEWIDDYTGVYKHFYQYIANDKAYVPIIDWEIRPNLIAELMPVATSVYRYHRPKKKGWMIEPIYPFADLNEMGRTDDEIVNVTDCDDENELVRRGLKIAQDGLKKYQKRIEEWKYEHRNQSRS